MKLIVMSCCGKKRSEDAQLAAIDRYDGPMWQTLRAKLAALPYARAAISMRELQIMVLSAKFGLVSAHITMPDYDVRLAQRRAQELLRDPTFDLQHLGFLVGHADAVLFAGGDLYRGTMWRAAGVPVAHVAKISETTGAGIGVQRAELAAWLDSHFGAARPASAERSLALPVLH